MHLSVLFWIKFLLFFWQQPVMRVEQAVIIVGTQRINCTSGQVANLPATSPGARTQTVRFELDLAVSEQEWIRLQNSRRMPIVFKWFRFSGARMFITSVVQDNNANVASAVSRQAGGTVVYRAQSTNERITSGTWVVAPVYADNTPLIINGRELSYQFRVP